MNDQFMGITYMLRNEAAYDGLKYDFEAEDKAHTEQMVNDYMSVGEALDLAFFAEFLSGKHVGFPEVFKSPDPQRKDTPPDPYASVAKFRESWLFVYCEIFKTFGTPVDKIMEMRINELFTYAYHCLKTNRLRVEEDRKQLAKMKRK